MIHIIHTAPGADAPLHPDYLLPTRFLDCDHALVREFADTATRSGTGARDCAVKLFYAVRDGWRYDPFCIDLDADTYVASNIYARKSAWCIQKGILLAAAARAVGIPAGIGLSDVTNHLTTDKLKARMGGSSLFVDHGYAVMFIDGRWIKAAPAFNIELCDRFGVRPTEFDGTEDAVFQEYDMQNRRHMEYLCDHGMWSDVPHQRIVDDLRSAYPASTYTPSAAADDRSERFEDGRRVD